jgi:hypothetical protein
MIRGYADDTSAFPGQTITFHVAADSPRQFRIDFYRQGATLEFKLSSDWMNAPAGDDHEPDQDWGVDATRSDGKFVAGWPPFPFTVPFDWPSGAYIAMFVEGDGHGNSDPNQQPPIDTSTADARSGKALFVVKNPLPGRLSQVLYKLPLFTYQMYNLTVYTGIDGQLHGGAAYPSDKTPRFWVTLRRPGGGTGGTPWDVVYCCGGDPPNQDPLDLGSYRQTFVHYDAKMISWLESNGYRVDYCTDMDIHRDDDLSLLSPYALVLSVGHDEYYSTEMRNHLEAYIANGGNMAFFSGNACNRRLIFPVIDDNGQPDLSLPPARYDGGPHDLRFITRDSAWATVPWDQEPNAPGRPEDSLTGVGFPHGGERNYPVPANDLQKVGYTVQYTTYWPFEQSGLADGDTFGKELCIVGYECDGAPFDKNAPPPVAPLFSGSGGSVGLLALYTPPGLVILGTGDTSVWPNQNGAATMAVYSNTGTVFTGATTDWARPLAQGDPATVAITRNVVNRLGGNPKGLAELRNIANLICCDGFFQAGLRHAVVGTGDGNIIEIPFSPVFGQPQGISDSLNGLLDLGAFSADADLYKHIVAVDSDGNVWDWQCQGNIVQNLTKLAKIPNAFRISGFSVDFTSDMYAVVATTDGNVFEVDYTQVTFVENQHTSLLGTFQNIVDVGGFFSPDDGFRHAIVGTADGTVTEIYFSEDLRVWQSAIANVPDLARVSAYYAGGDNFFRRRVQVLTGGGRIHEVRYHPDFGTMRAVLFNPGPLIDLGGFFTGDDNFRHAILATPAGDVQELFFNP